MNPEYANLGFARGCLPNRFYEEVCSTENQKGFSRASKHLTPEDNQNSGEQGWAPKN
jgi:hypothetical protein